VFIQVTFQAAKRLEQFFPWVYKNEILTPLDSFKPGDIVKVVNKTQKVLATGYINPNSTITFRALSWRDEEIDERFLKFRIVEAISKRLNIPSNASRFIYSEADFLPGLIVDYYNEHLSIQFLSAGMVRFKSEIIKILKNLLEPKGIVVEGNETSLKKEGIKPFKEVIGTIPSKVVIEENGIKFYVDLLNSQKTGFYLDQRKNRKIVTEYVKEGEKVLDCFSNSGGFGLYARKLKKAKVRAVDISEEAILLAKENFELNGVDGEFVVANVFDYLRAVRKEGEKFDLIILDPPSFAKGKANKEGAIRGFKDITLNALKLLKEGGRIALFSCSYYVGMEDLKKVVLEASKHTKKVIQIQEHLYQDIDHPYILQNPFSLYLKGILFKMVKV